MSLSCSSSQQRKTENIWSRTMNKKTENDTRRQTRQRPMIYSCPNPLSKCSKYNRYHRHPHVRQFFCFLFFCLFCFVFFGGVRQGPTIYHSFSSLLFSLCGSLKRPLLVLKVFFTSTFFDDLPLESE